MTGSLKTARVSLEQWQCLVAVVDAGGYAQAADRLHKSQSSVSYAVQKLESVLNVKVFSIEGRRAVLTPTGQMLYRRAQLLLEDSTNLEREASRASAGWETEVALAVEVLFPTWLLLDCMGRFGQESPQTRIELHETVIAGTTELLERSQVDLAITPQIPAGFNGELLPFPVRMMPVAHPDHPMHQLDREVSLRDLRQYRHLIVRDTASHRSRKTGTVEVEQRWTVSTMATSIGAVCRGHGFAWLPADKIRHELDAGILKPLPLKGGNQREAQLYLIFSNQDSPGPAVSRLAEVIREQMVSNCREHEL